MSTEAKVQEIAQRVAGMCPTSFSMSATLYRLDVSFLLGELESAHATIKSMAERIACQSDALSRAAEKAVADAERKRLKGIASKLAAEVRTTLDEFQATLTGPENADLRHDFEEYAAQVSSVVGAMVGLWNPGKPFEVTTLGPAAAEGGAAR